MFVMESPTLGISGSSLKHSLYACPYPSHHDPIPPPPLIHLSSEAIPVHSLQTFLLSDYRAKKSGAEGGVFLTKAHHGVTASLLRNTLPLPSGD